MNPTSTNTVNTANPRKTLETGMNPEEPAGMIHVDVEIIEDGLWCDEHLAHHRFVTLTQPKTHQGVHLGPSVVIDGCDVDAA
jgi:hypothetical protein